jgi:ATP-dependent RNA helicase DeaD
MKITELGLSPELIKALQEMGYADFTAIQEKSLPALLKGQDLLGEAPTGTGKTAAYCLPLLSRLDSASSSVQALVICPTRELAIQVIAEIHKFAHYLPSIRYAAIYGGQKISNQLRQLKANPQILVGTPGRLNDLLERKAISLAKVTYLVLDECDEMLEMGFIRDVNKIISQITSPHQSALFSATISPEIQQVAKRYLSKDAIKIQIQRTLTQENQIAQKYVVVKEDAKKEAIVNLLLSVPFRQAFVFCRTKHKVMQIAKLLAHETPHAVVSLQGNLSQNKRDQAMKAFRNYEANVLVATDIAARGIDVNDVDLVVNYDIPEEDEFYLHRIGRTGRVDQKGASYTFMTPSEVSLTKKYEALTRCPIEEYTIKKGEAMKKYLESLEGKLNDDLTEEKAALEEACSVLSKKTGKPVTSEDLAAILLKEKMADPGSSLAQEKDHSFRHNDSIERNKERKKFTTDSDHQRFFINVGFEDGADENSLKAFILKYVKSLELDDFTDVYLKGTFSFFEVPKDVTADLVHALEGTHFHEKLVHVEKTERPERNDRNKPYPSHRSDEHSEGRRNYGHASHWGKHR